MASLFDKIKDIFKPNTQTTTQAATPQSAPARTTTNVANRPVGTQRVFAPASQPSTVAQPTQTASPVKAQPKFGGASRTVFGKNETPTSLAPVTKIGSEGSLSQRAIKNGQSKGEDWSKASTAQKKYNETYYRTLDNPTHTKMYTDLESAIRTRKDATKSYSAGRDQLDSELDFVKKQYGKESNEYKALKQFIGDYEDLGRQMSANQAYDSAAKASREMDQTIDTIFSGVINSPDYRAKVEEGRKKIEANPAVYHRYKLALDAASDKQRDLMYYTFNEEGDKGARDFFDRFMGDTLNYEKAAKDFASDVTTKDTKASRFWEANKANWASAIDGQFGTGVRQTLKNTKADPNDKTLVGDYNISDSVDDYLRSQIGGNISDDDLSTYGAQGYSQLRYSDSDWLKEADKDASEYQKNMLGYLYLAYQSEDAAREAWGEIKQRSDAIWQTVNGSNSVATAASTAEGQLYRDYLGLAGADMPEWLGNPGQDTDLTVAQAVWDMAQTTRAQYPQIAANIVGAMAGGPAVGRVLGAAVMGTSAYGNAYKQAVDEGKDPSAATGYAATQAASEFAVGMLLDGIAPIAGALTGDVGMKFVQNISSPFVKAVVNAGVRGVGEGAEEYLQEIAEPLIRNFWFKEDNEFELFNEEAAYSFFLGAISALAMSPMSINTEVKLNKNFARIGEALNSQKSTDKLVDMILNNPVEGDKQSEKLYEEAKDLAEKIKNGTIKATDINAGELLSKYAEAGGDIGFLTDPATVAYNKETIGRDDMVAGATSMLSELGEDTALAADIASLAMGETITTEAQTKINESQQAQEVLSQLQGDLDMESNNALARAARATVFKGALNKIYSTLKNSNPDKNVITPAAQTLYDSGIEIKQAEKIGDVFNKVLDGQKLTANEAKLVKASSPAIRAAALQILGIDLSEYAGADMVLSQLNELAETTAKVKEQQAAVKRAAKPAAKARGAAMQGGVQNGLRETDDGRPAEVSGDRNGSGLQGQVPGAVPEGSGRSGAAGETPAHLNRLGQRSGADQAGNEAVRNPGVIPADQLDEGQRKLHETLVSSGFDVVEFVVGEDSSSGYNPETGNYECRIRVDGQFGQNQYASHERLHLWLMALTEARRKELLRGAKDIFGQDFSAAFNFVKSLYDSKGYNDGLAPDVIYWRTVEDMLCFANGGQSFRYNNQTLFDFSAYQDAVRSWIAENNLEAIGTGDMSNPAVQEAISNGWVNQVYYDRHGFNQTDSTEIDLGVAPETRAGEARRVTPVRSQSTQRAMNDADAESLRQSVKNLRRERKRLIREAEQNGTRNTPEHRDVINALNEQIEEYQNKIENLTGQHSADYDPEYFQSIGLITPDGTTASFTDNIGGVHEEILNQLNGTEGEDIKDFIARGGIRVKPNVGIEVNGDIAPTMDQYDLIDDIVENFTGKSFSIDFNIDGTSAGTHTFEGADLDPSRVYTYLRNYYARRKADTARNDMLKRFGAILGMPVKTMKDAYNLAKFQLQMDGDDPELQEIIDTYENQRYSADYLNPESEDYLGPEIDSETIRRGQEDDVYRNQDMWFQDQENEVDEDAIGDEMSAMSDDMLEAQMDQLFAELDTFPERSEEIFAKMQELQEKNFNKTKNTDESTETRQARQTQKSQQKAKTEAAPKKPKTPVEMAFQPKKAEAPVEEAKPEPKAEEKKPVKVKPIPRNPKPAQVSDNGVSAEERSAYEQLKAELEANPELANDPAFYARAVALAQDMGQQMNSLAERAGQLEAEAQAESEPEAQQVITVADTTKYAPKDKKGGWWKNIGKADSIEIRRRRSDRNTFDVRITDSKGNTVTYDEVSPAMLTKAFGVKTGDRATAMERARMATALAQNVSLNWSRFDNPTVEKVAAPKVKPNRSKDNLGRNVPVRLSQYMDKSAIRTADGALINTYRLAAENGVHNARPMGKFSMFTERPASMNIQRGMTGAAAYGQSQKSAGAKLEAIFDKLADPKTSKAEVENLRKQIAQLEEENKKYVSGITRLDPTRPDFQFAQRENIVNGKSVLETYLDIRKPKVIDAKGQGLDFVQREVRNFVNNPENKAGQFDANRDPIGPNDGFKFTNVNVVPEGQTLGGGDRDLDTVYVTFRNNQAKSTYNTSPTTSDLLQYSADYDAKVFGDMLDRGIIEKKSGGFHDIDRNYMSPMQGMFFRNAKSLDREGKLVYGVIPLFHGGRSLYLEWDPSKAKDAKAFFLATNPAVGETYMADYKAQLGPGEMVDLVKYEAQLNEITNKLGIDDAAAAINMLTRYIRNGSVKEKAEAAKTYAEIYNEIMGDEYGKITPVESGTAKQIEQMLAVMLDDQFKLGDLLADLEDVIDKMEDSDTRGRLEDFDDLVNSLYFAVDQLRTSKDLDWNSSYRAASLARQVANAEYITDPETGEILNHYLKDQAERIADQINKLDDLLLDRENVLFENEGMDGFYSTLDDLPPILLGTGVSAFYANTTNPLVVDGTDVDFMTGEATPGYWDRIDVSSHPELSRAFPGGTAVTDEIAEYARKHGYDSVIIHNIEDLAGTPNDGSGVGDIYIVFSPNQIKSVNNRYPTNDPRYNHSADYTDIDTGYEDGSLEDTILKILWDKDEERATAALIEYFYQFMQTGEIPQMENEKTRNIFQPRVTPGESAVINDQFKKFVEEYGALEKGTNPARDVVFPKKTDTGYARRFFRTAAESKNTPEWTMDALKREFLLDSGTYQRITDKAAIAYADRELQRKGYDKVLAEWQGKIDAEARPTKNDVAIGETLLNEALNAGDMETAMRLIAELADVGTTAGQTVQAFSMLKKMPKSYQLYYFQRVANRLNRQYAKRLKNGKTIKLNSKLAKAVLNAKTKEDLDTAIAALIQDIANQVPVNTADRWNAWRYLSMLGNPKTHIRNVLGNAVFAPAKFIKDLVAAGLETTLISDPNKRNTSFRGLLDRRGTAEYREFAEEDYEGIKQELQSGGKYNPTNAVMEARTIFKTPLLEKLRKLNGEWLEKEDGAFLKFHYVNALTNFLATRGVSIEDLQGTRAGKAVLNAARQYAFTEAQKATYRDASAVAAALNQVKRAPGVGILMEGLLPFAKTPVNILKRGVEYSPLGLLDTTTRQLAKLKNGDITANEFVDKLASGLTGTGIAILGFWLASQGLLKGGDDDDDKQAEADKLMGYQNYSINIGKTNYTIDWMAPSALPLFVGAAVFDELREKNGLTGADFYNALTVIAEPITQLSMLSGLNDTLKSAKWDDNPFGSVVQSMASGYVSQGLPTFMGQLARSFTGNRRTTYVDKNSDIPQPIQRWLQTNVMGKVPGLNNKRAEYIDTWGRKDTTQSFLLRVFDNMLSPGYRNEIEITPVDAELQRLAKEVGTGVLVSPAERSIEFNNEKHNLTAEQYETYAKIRGNSTFALLNDLFNSVAYQGLTDEEKAKAVSVLKDYGNVLGKQAVFPEYDPDTDNWAEKCDGDNNRLINMALLKAEASARDITVSNNGNFYRMVINTPWLTPVEQGYAMAQQYTTTSQTVYTRKGGPTYELTNDRKQELYQYIRLVFPGYYNELVATEKWQNANDEQKLELLSSLRSEVGGVAKAWLANQLYAAGAEQYTKK